MSKFTDFFKKIFKANPEVKNPQPTLRLPHAMYHQMDVTADLLEKSCQHKFDEAKISSLDEYIAFIKDEKNFIREEEVQIAKEALAREDVQNDILNDPSLGGLADVGSTQGNTFTYVGPETISEEDAEKYLNKSGLTHTVRARFIASTIDKVARMAVVKGEPIDFNSGALREIVGVLASDMAEANSKIANSSKTIFGETIKAIASEINVKNGVGSTYLALIQDPVVDGKILKLFPIFDPVKVFPEDVIENTMKHFNIAKNDVDFDKIEQYLKENGNPSFNMDDYLKGYYLERKIDLNKVMKYFNTDKGLFVATLRNKIKAEQSALQTCDLLELKDLLIENNDIVDKIHNLIKQRDVQTQIIEESNKTIRKNKTAEETVNKQKLDIGADIIYFSREDWNLDIGDAKKNKKYKKTIKASQDTLRADIKKVVRLNEEEIQDAITYASFGWDYERNIGTANPDLTSSDPDKKAFAEAEETRRLFTKLGKEEGYIYLPPTLEKNKPSTETGILITTAQHELMRKVYEGLKYIPGLTETAGIADSPVVRAKVGNKSFANLTVDEQVSLYKLVCVNASQEKYTRKERDDYASFISDYKAIEHVQKNISVVHRYASNVNLEQVRLGIKTNIQEAEETRTTATQIRDELIDTLDREQRSLKTQDDKISTRCKQINEELAKNNISYAHSLGINITTIDAGAVAVHNPVLSREDLMTVTTSRYEKINQHSIDSLTSLATSRFNESDLFNGRQVNDEYVKTLLLEFSRNNTEWLEKLTGDMYKSASAIQATLATQVHSAPANHDIEEPQA